MNDQNLDALIKQHCGQAAQAATTADSLRLDRLAQAICARAARTPQRAAPWRWHGLSWHWLAPNIAGMAAALVAGFVLARTAQPIDMMETAELVLRLDATASIWEESAL